MLTVICGEDVVASRNYFTELKNKYLEKKIDIYNIDPNQIDEVYKWIGESISLFSDKRIFVTQGLNKFISKKNSLQLRKVEFLIKDKNVILLDWEDSVMSRNLKFPKGITVREFKPSETIFKLVDNCFPGNLAGFIRSLDNISSKVADGLIFYLLARQLRNLIILKSGKKSGKMMDWQIWKLQKQLKSWEMEKLIAFYQGMHRIDVLEKTSQNPFELRSSLEILAYYIL
ncbi:hypothetical protein COS31_05000 [Candidatus Roizmanbacteria bacterium CG02_land_8_20_14_3_00_36_15]|uniref:DNA polymerase III delta N-terminal domain-containing protein n=2 Tax=Candidatus Roizmaniibacteriota TaxID=1752723 RepID=A0A2M8KL99_9BACT|nr:MAG: hypothetical protein COS51_05045 [Candidatus Roizmanbacteria bacterium CG03_land_8_20_14_0_80_36_21]PIV37375.1 MAG: hypothetical protein COS31_05000 [Candidatus Roizmanbacteria bacterium CG02_land_8_20_14_3_00_36_15]PIY70104.1 MAG: hypothetical protein COY89_02885 [Candidatus Roizmanbacteria bacterium CG_4_10_14_0_8_um_filter_36_36]PJA52710.1 MAG: hypothetical protein CO166_04615 [Candidatus Roizmanbacteria bacterium CG_4_9_14_3_um_filter_36_11]PJC81380.1 MAG: hypothetical protein CO007